MKLWSAVCKGGGEGVLQDNLFLLPETILCELATISLERVTKV